jgi:predicted TIM-barrel fold metal-dependent hydrolase
VQGVAAASASGQYGEFRGCAGIVGTADLRLGHNVVPVLEAQMAASPNRFRGIRHRAAWPENRPRPGQPAGLEHLYMDEAFRRGFSHLRQFGMSFEAWLYHNQLSEVVDLAQAFPDTTIILNHLGGPLLTAENPKSAMCGPWRRSIAAIASCPNVVVKLGGIQMPVNGFGWHERAKPPTSDELVDENSDWYSYAIDQFGPSRSMFESNFPVDRASCSYTVLYNSFKKMSLGFREDERVALFHDTAARVYRLPLANESQ